MTDILSALSRRFIQLNRGVKSLVLEAKDNHPDGHGEYVAIGERAGKSFEKHVFVTPVKAKALARHQNNKNLDFGMRL